jgi:hypothetical protein
VGIAGLTPDEPSGTPEHGRDPHRRDFQPHLIKAVGGRTWHGHAYGPAGPTVFLTPATVAQPLQPVAAAADRRLIEPGGLTARQQPWSRQPPPQNTARAGRVHVLLTVRRFAWATAWGPCAPVESGGEPVGWQPWRRQLQEQTRALGLVCAPHDDGSVPLAEDSRLWGVPLKARPPGLGTRPQMLATYRIAGPR